MKIYPVFILLSFFFACNVQAITINEIMPNPDDGCYDCSEWIEITSHVNTSLENITVDTGDSKNTTLNGSIGDNEFIIITQDAAMFELIWNSNATVFENRGMSLHNGGDNITIYSGSEVLHKLEYIGSETNRSYGLCNSTFILQNISTPGLPNICPSEEKNETNETNQTDVTNETCDLSLSIASDLIFLSEEKHTYYLSVRDENCDQEEKEVGIEYWIEDLFGGIAKSKYTTTQSITCYKNISRQWTPKKIEGSEAFCIKAMITNLTCNDSDSSNDFAERIVIVKGEKPGSDECPPCETSKKQSTCSCAPCPKCPSEEEKEKEEEEFKIVSSPREIVKDEEIEIELEIKNILDRERNYTVYSYVYEGNRILSMGLEENSWLNTWDANRQNVSIQENSSVTLELRNRIAEDTNPGKYKLRVRIWCEGEKHDLTRDILVKEPLSTPNNQTTEEQNGAENNESEEEKGIPTGRIVSRMENNWFSSFIESIANFFKNLFRI